MSATGIGVTFVILASIGLAGTLVGVLVWLLAVIVKGVARTRSAPPATRR